jgi:hypothetical protein
MRPRGKTDDIDSCGLTLSELQELWLGVGPNGSLFRGEDELRAAWDRGRGAAMRLWANNGRRPMAWWYLEAPGVGLTWPGYDHQQSYLFEHNALSEAECEQLVAGWRRDFEDACLLEDAVARRKHLDWADVPHSLRRQWAAARRRRRSRVAPEKAADAASSASGGEEHVSGPSLAQPADH